MKPPSGGPSTGPISAGMVSQDMALTRSRLLTVRSSTSRPTGVIMAPPMPCTNAGDDEIAPATATARSRSSRA